MKKYLLSILAFALLCNSQSKAQLVGADVFLKGDYVEAGIATSGAYGTGGNAPTGYHPRPDFGLTSGPMGFVSDPEKDGWSVSSPGSPDYFGDFFLPGAPQEGWDIQVNGSRGLAWRGSGAASMTGGLTGSNTAYTAFTGAVPYTEGVWEGTFGTLSIKQTTTLKKDKLYFVTRVELKNTGATTLNGIYYNRSVDPEPDATIASNYSSNKKIIFQPTFISRNTLVVATGQDFPKAYLGLGTKDCRALCYITNTYTPDAPLNNVFSKSGGATGYIYNVNASSAANTSMGLVFNVGNLAPGASTELAYTYILKQADLDSALDETAPSFVSDSAAYKAYTTFRVCPGSSFPLKIKGGTAYKWTWTPGTGLSADSMISSGSLPPTGGAYGDSIYITVTGPQTYRARGVSLCDTSDLIFYVDTLNFSTAPFVTTPLTYCQLATTAVPLTAGGATGATILWSNSIGGPETTVAPTPSTATAGLTRYYVRQQSTAGCFSQYAFIDVEIIAKPEPPSVRDTVYCYGTIPGVLSADGTNVKWYDAVTGGTKYPTTPVVSTLGTTNSYFPSQTISGCESDRSTLTVDIAKITASFTAAKDSLCGNELMVITNTTTNVRATATEPFTSNWNFADGNTDTNTNPTHSYTNIGNYIVKLQAINPYGCKDSAVRKIYVAPESVVSFTQSDTLICQGESVDYVAKATPNYNSTVWDFGDGDVKNYNHLLVRKAFTKPGIYDVSFKASYTVCGDVETKGKIEITPIPNVNIGQDATICPGQKALILQNNTASTASHSYRWSTGDSSATISVNHPGTYALSVREGTCVAADSIIITKGCYIDIPNAFNPNDADPANAYFFPRSLLSKSIISFDMKIFNRWGEELFVSTSLDGKGWDGKFHGQDQPMGVYVYQIRVSFTNGLTENYSGNVTLIR